MICPHCNFDNEQNAAFCTQCGTPIGQNSEQQNNNQQSYNQQNYSQPNYNQQQSYYEPPGFCRNCGQHVAPGAAVCLNCGVAVGNGHNFCAHCGTMSDHQAVVCTNCGVPLHGAGERKSKVAAGLLGIFLGMFGVHNFYLGYTTKAIIQLVSTIFGFLSMCIVIGFFIVPGIAIWGLVEGIMILTGSIAVDGRGVPLKD